MTLELRVNGLPVRVDSDLDKEDEDTPLLAVLREHIGLTGSKYGCAEGECGACTVLVGGEAVRSCITPVGSVAGKDVLTIEGLERGGQLHRQTRIMLELGELVPGTHYVKAVSARSLLKEMTRRTFKAHGLDMLLSPTLPTPTVAMDVLGLPDENGH